MKTSRREFFGVVAAIVLRRPHQTLNPYAGISYYKRAALRRLESKFRLVDELRAGIIPRAVGAKIIFPVRFVEVKEGV